MRASLTIAVTWLSLAACANPDGAASVRETVVRRIAPNAEPFDLDAAVFGARPAREPWPLRLSGPDRGVWWEGTVEPLEDRWGIPRPAPEFAAVGLSVLCVSEDAAAIAFGVHEGAGWLPVIARRAAPGLYEVVARGETRYAWFDWPALDDRLTLVAWAVTTSESALLSWHIAPGGALVLDSTVATGFEKYWPFWSRDGATRLVRAIRVQSGSRHTELLLDVNAGGATLFAGRSVGWPVLRPDGKGWACVVDDARGAFLRIANGQMIGPYDAMDRPRATQDGIECAARRGGELLRVRVR